MDKLIKDLAIEPFKIGNIEINHLRIEISHDKGGHSWGTGEWRPCGVRADIKPIEKKGPNGCTVIGCCYDGKTEHQGFFVHLIDCQRKSPKKIQIAADKVFPHAEEIRDLFLEGKYVEIATLLQNIKY